MRKCYLGVDVGSVSTNIVLVDHEDNNMVYESLYIRTNGQPINAVKNGLMQLREKGYKNADILGVGITGSARNLIGHLIGADVVKNEITAHAMAAMALHPDVKTILEIGGQDSKIIIIRDKVVVDFAMNTVCAAGTGSFLDQQAFRLNIPIQEFGDLALQSTNPVRIAGRCTVFAESDMIHKQQLGFSKQDIIMGLCEALVRNYLNNIAKGKPIEGPILFQGGVAHNKGILAAFANEIKQPIIIPKYFPVMGALGGAVLARQKYEKKAYSTHFKGFESVEDSFEVKMRVCDDCSNSCELTEAFSDSNLLATWGDRCGKCSN